MATTFVIVHGAGSGGWLWQGIRQRLQARGHAAYTPTLTGAGERAHLASPSVNLTTHINDVLGVLTDEDLRDVALVGHSYGGMVITGVADRAADRLARLVYIDAFVPADGQALLDFTPPPIRAMWEEQARTTGDGWKLPPLPFGDVGRIEHGGPTQEEIANLLARRVPQPLATYTEAVRLKNPAAAALPRIYIRCTDKPAPDPFAHVAAHLRGDAHWHVEELTTGHFPMLTTPRTLTEMLLRLCAER